MIDKKNRINGTKEESSTEINTNTDKRMVSFILQTNSTEFDFKDVRI
jgi:hypothetical protein